MGLIDMLRSGFMPGEQGGMPDGNYGSGDIYNNPQQMPAGTYGSRAAQLKRQRELAELLREKAGEAAVDKFMPGWTSALTGASMSPRLVAGGNDVGTNILRGLGGVVSAYKNRQLDQQQGELDQQARDEAQRLYKSVPRMETMGEVDSGNPYAGKMPGVVQKSPAQYQSEVAAAAAGADPTNPYAADFRKQMLDKSLAMATKMYDSQIDADSGTDSSLPLSYREYMLGTKNPGYNKYVRETFRGTNDIKNAATILGGGPLAQQIMASKEFAQNPSKESAATALRTVIMNDQDGYIQKYGDQAQAMMEHDYSAGLAEINNRFAYPSSTPTPGGMSAPAPGPAPVPMPSPAPGPGPAPVPMPAPAPVSGPTAVPMPAPSDMDGGVAPNTNDGLNPNPRQPIKMDMSGFDPAYLAQLNKLPGNEVLEGPAADQNPPANLAQLNAEEAAVRAGGPLPQSPTSALPRASGRGLPPPTDKAKLEQSVATGKEMGTETGKAIMALPVAEATVDRAIGHLDELAKDPMAAKVGTPGYAARKLPSALGVGTSESDFAARVKQASGDMMRSAYDAIRGTGPITDKEMEPLIAAMTRVSDARTPKGFQDAIKDAKAALKMTLELAKKKARVTTTDDLVKKYGS